MAGNLDFHGFDYADPNLEKPDQAASSDAFDNFLSRLNTEPSSLGLINKYAFDNLGELSQGPIAGENEGGQLPSSDFVINSIDTTPRDTTPSGIYSPSSHGSGLLQTESDVASCTGSGRMENKELDDFLEKVRNIERPFPPPKIGARFSQKSTRILNQWLSNHPDHPYPKGDDIEMLRNQTGLSKTQITNWLSNARRRGKVSSASKTSQAKPMDIPQNPSPRPGTPAPRRAIRDMNPMERWVESPPEHEPASMLAIARAMAKAPDSGSFEETYPSDSRWPDSIPNQSSASSAPTSLSSGSLALSHSGASLGSISSSSISQRKQNSRKRAKQARARRKAAFTVEGSLRKFQCTFCTETFKTKYDWQRHERSLHVPLEKWVCVPYGPVTYNEDSEPCCALCGRTNPDDNHLSSHNFSTCIERTSEARSFNRKDHLNQHLRLAHNSKYSDALMKSWKREITQLRSRCGFCDVVLDTWDDRVNHLADHFRLGCTMGDWKGNWGFEKHMLDVIENSMPPYLIEADRRTPFPFKASAGPPESPASAYELIKLELVYFMQGFIEQHERLPGNEELQLEACRVILASEILSSEDVVNPQSWLRDLIMSDDAIVWRAKLGPMRARHESKLDNLQVLGKTNLFDECPMETQLRECVATHQMLGSALTMVQLQQEARSVIERTEASSEMPCDIICAWLMGLATSSVLWLQKFCTRSGSAAWLDFAANSLIDAGGVRLQERDHLAVGEQQGSQLALGPVSEGFQHVSRTVQHEDYLHSHQNHQTQHAPVDGMIQDFPGLLGLSFEPSSSANPVSNHQPPTTSAPQTTEINHINQASTLVDGGQFFLHEANFHRRLERDLHRWVAATVSPKNPSRHLPSDEEIQHYARWIMYNDEDPWNQTPADNEEWLQAFKRDAGILPSEANGLLS
ncbi:hypothetical protein BGZ63DRAFT_247283 [Mariannaea sp. PMI_226]|nr:hypothetical protein BGZ63DRAFT_247283 [Mariannaea sp. PMI_226]